MNDLPRCHGRYQKDPLYLAYHDEEWGRPEHDDKKLYELFLLELFQAGLSWSCILHKRESFRNAFDGFDLHKIAAYGQRDVERLLADPSIIRSSLKILAAINNANIVLSIISEFGSFDRYLWSFTDGRTLVVDPSVTRNAASDAMAIDMKRRGIKFAGSVTLYSFMQAYGQINSHEPGCFVFHQLQAPGPSGRQSSCAAPPDGHDPRPEGRR